MTLMEEDPENAKYLGDEGKALLKEMGYGVVDREYDVFEWIDPRKKSKGKQKVGKKTCRFVQPADGSKSIIPNILRKLLKARKSTRKLIVFQTVTLDDGSELSGLYSCKEVNGVETVTIVIKMDSHTEYKISCC